MPVPKENVVLTYAMYRTWPDKERWELIIDSVFAE